VLQNNFLPILRPEELACAKLSTQAKDYSGLENDRGDYFVAVKEMNQSLTPVHYFFSFKFELQLQGQYHSESPSTSRTLFWEHRSSHFFIVPNHIEIQSGSFQIKSIFDLFLATPASV